MAVSPVGSLNLGNYLKIVSKGAVYNNLSEDSPIWEMIKKKKKGPEEGRELRFLLRSAYGSGAAGFVPVDGGAYPNASQATITEGTTQYKDFALTVEVERTLIAKAISDFSRYGEPLAEELRAKTIALSRILSGSVYRDGTGVIGTVDGSPAIAGSPGEITVTLKTGNTDRGFIGWFDFGDKVQIYSNTGTQQTPTLASGTFDHFTVETRDRANDQVVLAARNSAGTKLDITALNTISDGDVIYRNTQSTFQDLTAIGSTDYQTLSEDWAGLDSFAENDGRVVNGITLSGALGGTRRDAGGQPIDSQDFQQLMSQVMVAVGQGRYKYTMAMMAWETLDALIESRETDRRFQDVKDNRKGVESLGYIHGKNNIVFEADEFCPKNRIYCLPEGDVLQFHGSDFEFVQPEGGQKFFLRPNAAGHDRTIRAYMEGSGALVSVHSAAIGTIENFTV